MPIIGRLDSLVLVLLAAWYVIEFSLAPLFVAPFPYDYVITDLSECREYTTANRGTTAVGYRGETSAEPLVDFIESIALS